MIRIWDFVTSGQFLLPLALLAAGIAAGLVIEKVVLRAARSIARVTRWQGYRMVRSALRGMITLWFAIAGLYAALHLIDLSPNVAAYYHQGFLVLMVFSLTLVVARFSAGLVDLYIRMAEGSLPSATILGNALKIAILLTGALVILTLLDVPIAPMITALGIGGFAVALAFNDTLSNLFSGMHILASRLIRPGDFVRLDTGEEGYVSDVTWRNTTIRTLPNNMVVIPNSRLASAIITNFNQPVKDMAVLVEVGVGYASDLDEVERLTVETAREVLADAAGGSGGFEPFIRYHTFSELRIEFTVILHVEEYVDQYELKHEFIKRLSRAYRQAGVEIPYIVHRMDAGSTSEDVPSPLKIARRDG